MREDIKETRNKSTSQIALGGMVWTFAERICAQLVTLVVSIVLARLLSPDEYSIVAIVTIFVTIANVFVTSGFGSSLVQKLNVDALDFSTSLYFSLAFSVCVYLVLFFTAPFIADAYEIDLLVPVIRIMSLRIIFASINSVQQAYISKTFQFKKFFLATLVGTVISAVVGIAMAYTGFGVWALVAQYLTNVCIDTLVLSLTCGWKPKLIFSFHRLRGLFSYGCKVMATTVTHTFITQTRALVLSKVTTPTVLSYYNQGEKFPALFINNIETSVQKVMAPILSNEQKNKQRVLELTRKALQVSTFVIWPLLIGLAAVAEPLIEALYTSKWLGSVPYLKLICLAYLFYPVGETHVRTIRALGRSDITMWTVFFSDLLNILLLLAAIVTNTSGNGIVVTWIISEMVMAITNGLVNNKLIGYKLKLQFKDLFFTGISCLIMFIIVRCVSFLSFSLILDLVIKVLVGAGAYICCSYLINRESLCYFYNVFSRFIGKKRATKNNEEYSNWNDNHI